MSITPKREITMLSFKGTEILNSPIGIQNLIELTINKMGELTPDKGLEILVEQVDVGESDRKVRSSRWGKSGPRVLSHKSRAGKHVLLFNIDTKFYVVVNNQNCPKEFKKMLKDNPTMFTHSLTIEADQMSGDDINNAFSKLTLARATKRLKVNLGVVTGLLTELQDDRKKIGRHY